MKEHDVVHTFVERGDIGLFLQHRDDIPGIYDPGTLAAFGGAVEPTDKSIEAAARRELFEETGISDPIAFEPLGSVALETNSLAGKPIQVRCYVFRALVDKDRDISVYEGQGGVTVYFGQKLPKDKPFAPITMMELEKYYRGRFL